ncbi:MAG: molecular chaperone DnaK (HSP70) [Verrucomicrobiales bacterium]|jgi:molecular chaperone DnaK (HSP70)
MKFSIGIDLGTTNCALAYVPLAKAGAESRVLPISQWGSPGALAEHETLPSFLFLPAAAEAASFVGQGEGGSWIPGAYARKQAADRPGAVAHSAKSWLCHHAVDRSQPILPWGSSEISSDEKISPVRASALLLNYLRHAWDSTIANGKPDAAFDAQQITVTVPASFDAVAQKLTLEAASAAGFPDGIRLLEEPQAAFYRWLERHPEPGALLEKLPRLAKSPQHVLVVDIGGGTSDFSLFEIQVPKEGALPNIKRVAVSDHILLGGDNVDLALAHLVEPRVGSSGESGHLTAKQWNYLVARCRDLKERILSESEAGESDYTVSVPSAGSSLIAGTQSAGITREEILSLLLDGFFPSCDAGDKPEKPRGALRELGLPYASDSAITKHLAAFLDRRPRIDAILFNGGTLFPEKLRQRLAGQIAAWQAGHEPAVLNNSEPNLAVARGAAHYGALFHRKRGGGGSRIEAGAAHAVFLEVAAASSGKRARQRSLVCILPRGTQPESEILVSKPEMRLRLNRKVEFQPWYSTRRERDKAGAVVSLDDDAGFHSLPSLHTAAGLAKKGSKDDSRIPVHLRSKLNAVGLLNVACVSADDRIHQSWPLEFDLQTLHGRSHDDDAAPATDSDNEAVPDPGVDAEAFSAAEERIAAVLGNPWNRRDPATPARLIKSLEKILGQPKQNWNGALVRGLWPAMEACFDDRATSTGHEETWLSCSGFLLRPGYGAALDDARIDSLWRLHESGLAFPNKGNKIQTYVLWRRLAGGLDRARQSAVLDPELQRLREAKNPPADLVRLAGVLERLDLDLKRELAGLFLTRGAALAREGGHAAPFFAALTSLLSRTPAYAGPETILPPETVEEAFEALRDLDWSAEASGDILTLFLRAARLTGDRNLDILKATRKQILAKLEKADVAPLKLHPLREAVPLAQSDRALLIGESLPPGISLAAG